MDKLLTKETLSPDDLRHIFGISSYWVVPALLVNTIHISQTVSIALNLHFGTLTLIGLGVSAA